MNRRIVAACLTLLLAGAIAAFLAHRGAPATFTPRSPAGIEVPHADEPTEDLLAMDGGDLVTMSYVTRVLRAHGIWSSTQGSIGWGTSVRTSERAEAERWLRQEAGLRGYVTWLPSASRDSIPPPTRREVRIDADVASALRVHASDTIVGRILRSEDLRRYLRGSTTAKVDGVSWISRPLVNEALKPTTAIVGTVDLRSVTSQFPHATTCTVVLEEH